MKLAVTGATGFLGGHFIDGALAAGYRIRALCRPSSHRQLFNGRADLTVIEGDLRQSDPALLAHFLDGAEVLVHLAAAGVQARQREWHMAAKVNVLASLALVQAAEAAGIRKIVSAGTCLEYQGYGRLPNHRCSLDPLPRCSEDAPLATNGIYGPTKAAGSLLMQAHSEILGITYIHLRFASIYGPGDDQNKFLPSLIHSLRYEEYYRMTPGEQVRDWLWVQDAVNAILLAATGADRSGCFNVGTGDPISLSALAKRIASDANRPDLLAMNEPYRPGEPHCLVLDPSRAKSEFGWVPTVSLDEGLMRMTLSCGALL